MRKPCTQTGTVDQSAEEIDVWFAQEIQTINERLMKTQANQAALFRNTLQLGNQRGLLQALQEGISTLDSQPLDPLTADQYLEVRLADQVGWYQRKVLGLDRDWQQFQWAIYILGGVGTLLAALEFQVWIAVTNAVATAMLGYLEFRRLDFTLVGYNQAAANLENISCWWHSLTPSAQQDPNNIQKLVDSTEKSIQAETTGWVQEMRDALASLHEGEKSTAVRLAGGESPEPPSKSDTTPAPEAKPATGAADHHSTQATGLNLKSASIERPSPTAFPLQQPSDPLKDPTEPLAPEIESIVGQASSAGQPDTSDGKGEAK